MNGYIVTIIIAFIFGPILALPILIVGLFNIMDFALYSFPIFFFCIMGYRQDKKVKDAFKGLIPGLIVSLILTTFVLFVKDQSDCTNKYDSGSLSAAVCERLEGRDLDNGSLNGGAARHGTLQSYCTKTNNMVNF
ncbi:hypothetical protein [Klebsiella pneumoniae]|uniref:hypothetical protein n=2 Tax=Klebsiella pneumoniae TaxID=573 RepID=UPI001D0E1413|nr:hypothetical protein [Klebsiella pneumoniae]